jgi:hypothetical protein
MPRRDDFDWGDHSADRAYHSLPDWFQGIVENPVGDDQMADSEEFKNLFGELFAIEGGRVDWDTAKAAHDALESFVWTEYGIVLDDYFDWDDWRANYEINA